MPETAKTRNTSLHNAALYARADVDRQNGCGYTLGILPSFHRQSIRIDAIGATMG